MKQKNYRILNYNFIPTKLFLAYCELSIEDFVRAATIEKQIKGKERFEDRRFDSAVKAIRAS